MRSFAPIPLLVALAASSAGCSGELTLADPAGGGAGADGGSGGGDDLVARQMWDSDVAPLMSANRQKGACVGCHRGTATVGPAFLGATEGESFDALTATGLIGATPQASRFLMIGEHTGNGFCTGIDTPSVGCTGDETGVVAGWIEVLKGG